MLFFALLLLSIKQNKLVSSVNAVSVSYVAYDSSNFSPPYLYPTTTVAWTTVVTNDETNPIDGILYATVENDKYDPRMTFSLF